jgi:hypothetical protein
MADTVNNLRNKIDAGQVLQAVYEEDQNRLRVNAELVAGGTTEVIINHEDDSIRIGDGTSLVTTTTTGGKVALDVNDISGGVTSPGIFNLNMGLAGIELSQALPNDTKRFLIRARDRATLRLAYNANETNTGPWLTIPKGTNYTEENLELSSGLTLYIQSDRPSHMVEITYWT